MDASQQILSSTSVNNESAIKQVLSHQTIFRGLLSASSNSTASHTIPQLTPQQLQLLQQNIALHQQLQQRLQLQQLQQQQQRQQLQIAKELQSTKAGEITSRKQGDISHQQQLKTIKAETNASLQSQNFDVKQSVVTKTQQQQQQQQQQRENYPKANISQNTPVGNKIQSKNQMKSSAHTKGHASLQQQQQKLHVEKRQQQQQDDDPNNKAQQQPQEQQELNQLKLKQQQQQQLAQAELQLDWFHNLCMLLRADLSLIQRLVAKQYLKSD